VTGFDPIIIAGAIITAAWVIAKAIEEATKNITAAIETHRLTLDRTSGRVGDKLDALWSPIKGLNNAAWQKLGVGPADDIG
jgi:hypothetical protein